MIVVHHLNHSRSQRVMWLLEELGQPYRIEFYQRDAKTMLAPPALRRIHPLGKSPVVVDGDAVLAESGAIVEALVERYDSAGQLAPALGTPERQRWRYWLHYAEGSLMPPLLVQLLMGKVAQAPWPVRPIAKAIAGKVKAAFVAPNLKNHFDFLEAELTQTPWLAGQTFSAADIHMSFPVEAAAARAGLDQRWPHVMDWLQRIQARPAYQTALQKGGPFEVLG